MHQWVKIAYIVFDAKLGFDATKQFLIQSVVIGLKYASLVSLMSFKLRQ